MTRNRIPKKLKLKIMYDIQYACVVCQQRGSHIHHIDENPSNNKEENLVLLCSFHHDEAHTKHQLSQNLSPDSLCDAKQKWVAAVKKNRELISTVSGQLSIAGSKPLSSIGITWGYINHRRVAQLAKPGLLTPDDKQYFEYCVQREIVDKNGILIKPTNAPSSDSYARNSVYDWYEHGDDQRLHRVYTAFVDQISGMTNPIHLETESLTKTRIIELVNPGNFIFLNRAFYFKGIEETRENEHRLVHATRGKVKIKFFIDTMNMFGTTSMTESFSRRKNCAALLHLKSFEEKEDGQLILHCTPIALGVGFNKQW